MMMHRTGAPRPSRMCRTPAKQHTAANRLSRLLPGRILWPALLISAVTLGSAAEADTTRTFTGEAYDLETGDLIYTEQHSLQLTDGIPSRETVVYVTPDGNELARKEMRYWRPERPAYRLSVSEPQRTETVEPDESGVTVESVESGTLAWSDETASVIDGGFHYFIQQNFEALLAGETVDFNFLAPTRVRWTPLRITPVGQEQGQLQLELNLQNRLLSWAVSDIELTYDIEQRQLLLYSGLTNLPKPGGGNYRARIEYQYPQADPS